MRSALPWIAALAATPLASCSPHAAGDPRGVFEMVDTNDDSQITVDEFSAAYFTMTFARLDIDGDGRVTRAEWTTVETHDAGAATFLQTDQDGDGSLTYDEFSSTLDRPETTANMFGTLDSNGDTVLLQDEIILSGGRVR